MKNIFLIENHPFLCYYNKLSFIFLEFNGDRMITTIYSAGIVSESFWFSEFKEYLKLVKENMPSDEIKNSIVKNNLFGVPNEYRAGRVYGYIKKRADSVDEQTMELFFSSDLSTQKLINFICIMRNSRILFEFVNEVYKDKIITGTEIIERSDVSIFFKNKDLQSEEVAEWKDATKKRLCGSFLTMLTEANMLSLKDKKRYINLPILDTELEKYLESNGEADIIKAITGVY